MSAAAVGPRPSRRPLRNADVSLQSLGGFNDPVLGTDLIQLAAPVLRCKMRAGV